MGNQDGVGEVDRGDTATDSDEGDGRPDEGDGQYTCRVCGRTFDSAGELHKHLYRVGLVE